MRARGDTEKGRQPFSDRAPALAAIAIIALVVVLTRLPHLGTGPLDFDEGVYWLSMRSLRAGNPLYAAVYSSQPPAFLLLTEPPWSWLGGSIEAARSVMVAWSVGAVVAGAVLTWCLVGRWAAVATAVLLSVDPRMVAQSIQLQADGPATSLALLSLAAAAVATSTHRSRWGGPSAAAAGALLAIGILTKLFDVGIVPALVMLLAGSPRRWRHLGLAAAAATAVAAMFLVPQVGSWPAMWQQAVGLHLSSHTTYPGIGPGFVGTFLQTEWPVVALALVSVVAGRSASRRAWTVGMVWTAGAVVAFAATRPLFPHHLVLVVPGLALLGATAVARAASWVGAHITGRRTSLVVGIAAAATTAAAAILLADSLAAETAPTNPALVARLAVLTAPSSLVLGDDQYDQAAAARDAPPGLVDTSGVRIRGGGVTAATLEAALQQDPRTCAVLFATGRLSGIPGFVAWVAVQYPERTTLPGGAVLYETPRCAG